MSSAKEHGLYPIRAASRLTRLSVDTLRAWERRYEAVAPGRRNGIRLYTAADIERLCMLRDALNHGHSIGQAAALSNADLKLLLAAPVTTAAVRKMQREPQRAAPLDTVIAAIEGFSYTEADRELSRLSWLMTPRDIVHRVALPLMQLAGQRFHDKRMRASQEHMLTQLLGNLLGSMMRIHTPENPAAHILMATFSGDLHAFGILAAGMLAASAGLRVIHLGASLPPEEISYAAKRAAAEVVLMSVTGTDHVEQRAKQFKSLSGRLSRDTELWLGVNPPEIAPQLVPPRTTVRVITNFPAFEQQLQRIGGRF